MCIWLELSEYTTTASSTKIPRSVFVAYLQGFHGWAVGEIIDGEYIEYDGVSGAQGVLFNLLNMFLGLETFIDEESFANYFPISQRRFMEEKMEDKDFQFFYRYHQCQRPRAPLCNTS